MPNLYLVKYEGDKTKEVYADELCFGVPVSSISLKTFGDTHVEVIIDKNVKCEFHNYPQNQVIIRQAYRRGYN